MQTKILRGAFTSGYLNEIQKYNNLLIAANVFLVRIAL